MRKYNYLLTINLAVFLLLFLPAADASAKTVTFEKEYTYQASEKKYGLFPAFLFKS